MTSITGETRLLAVIGHPVSHSLSPQIHNRFAEALGLAYAYMAFDVTAETLGRFLDAARLLGIAGFNVTMPLKESILPHLDRIGESAERYGAVNTVVNRGGALTGHNTDGGGFLLSLEGLIDLERARALILGAGGAAKAVALALGEKRAEVRTVSRRQEPVGGAASFRWDDIAEAAKGCSLLVNATPLGMHGVREEFADFSFLDSLEPGAAVFDLVYAPRETLLLREASRRGYRALNGLSHLVRQAALSFELFTGQMPSPKTIGDTLAALPHPF